MSELNYNKIISAIPAGHGHRLITIQYHSKQYSAVTNNMPLFDKFNSKEYGWKTAGNELYDFVKMKNGLIKL